MGDDRFFTESRWNSLRLGSHVEGYHLLELLAVGGMAEIYLARESLSQRLVVIKRAHERVLRDQALRRMFVEEARIASRLVHENIVRVIDGSKAASHGFYVMEYLDGRDVLRLLGRENARGKAMPLSYALTIAVAAADGLHAAHELRGSNGRRLHLVHRDVSPCNIHVGADGRVCLLDFGVARAALDDRIRTAVGLVKGKLSYMAPEQMRGAAERRSDVFSLGVVLYEMTVGRKLFRCKGKTLRELQGPRHITPPSVISREYPEELETIVLTALQADAGLRFWGAADLAAALREFAAKRKIPLCREALGRYVRNAMGVPAAPQDYYENVDVESGSAGDTMVGMAPHWVEPDRTVVESFAACF